MATAEERLGGDLMLLIRKLIKNKRGQALVELALALPLLLIIVMGTIEFGRIFHSYVLITNASREGARVAVTGVGDAAITNRINNVTSTLGTKEIIIEPDESVRLSTSYYQPYVTVTVKYKLNLITPLIDTFVPNPITLTTATSMKMEK